MIMAEFTDWIDNLIHLPQGHSVHLLVELVEVRLYLLIVIGIIFVIAFVEHGQDGLSIAKVRGMHLNIGFQCFKIRFHSITLPKRLV